MSDGSATDQITETSSLARRAWQAAVAAWLVPGAGHLLLGRKRRAAAFLVIVMSALVIGLALDGNLYRVEPDRPLTLLLTLGSMGLGGPYLFLRFVAGYSGQVVAPGFEYGSAFIVTAGLMNMLLVLDVLDIVRGRKE